ncbi:MAG: PQQ-dependent sugar dehydrogenase [Longimicrobiales bacterium]
MPLNCFTVRRVILLLLMLTTTSCTDVPSRPASSSTAAARMVARPPFQLPGIALDTIASGLSVPWALAFAPDGRIFVTERVGRIRVIEAQGLRAEPWATLGVHADEEGIWPESGLMGIALAPDFAQTGHLYVMGTFRKRGLAGGERKIDRLYRRMVGLFSETGSLRFENRVYRLTDRGGRGQQRELVIAGLPANHYHAGGALTFGPDGKLFVSNGEALISAHAQNRNDLVGKILRYMPDGSIPNDNPFPGSPVFAYGTRNVQGLAWEPRTSALFAIDHGPTFLPHEGGRSGKDELNLIGAGANLGWPIAAGIGNDTAFVNPVTEWSPAIAPGGLAFYLGSHLPWRNNAFIGGLRGHQLRRVAIEQTAGSTEWRVTEQAIEISQVLGRIRAVAMGPDGFLYITTSNRDGRGVPAPTDDLLLRVRPLGPATATNRNPG